MVYFIKFIIKQNNKNIFEEYHKIDKSDIFVFPEYKYSEYMYIFNCDDDFPTKIFYDLNGDVQFQEWLDSDGEYHRDGKPAIIEYVNGIPRYKEYWSHGKFINRIEVNG